MPTKEEQLEKLTFKGQCDNNSHRVFYTLTTDSEGHDLTQHRIANVLSGVIAKLVEKEILTEAELDDILLECTG